MLGILFHHIQEKSRTETHMILTETCGNYALWKTVYRDWFRHLKNSDFDVEDKQRFDALKRFKDEELGVLIHEDSCQMLSERAQSLEVDHTTVLNCLKL